LAGETHGQSFAWISFHRQRLLGAEKQTAILVIIENALPSITCKFRRGWWKHLVESGHLAAGRRHQVGWGRLAREIQPVCGEFSRMFEKMQD